ncbi:MAG: hypothetical protein GX638_13090 [Crenarchaeota archaeon]|nr:hypothetical protein [Thermoproteota archaeon]
MERILEKEKTLLVDGPASITVLAGKLEIFGFQARKNHKIIIREGKRLPFTASEPTRILISLGANTKIEEINGSSIPTSWDSTIEGLWQIKKKPITIMVIGEVDTGKTSFCTYLTNKLVNKNFQVGVLDEDLGQSDIGPPGAIAYSYVSFPITDIFDLETENAIFLGTTTPVEATNKIIEATVLLKTQMIKKCQLDFLIINTDGWLADENAINFKIHLAEALEVDMIFWIQNTNKNTINTTFEAALPNINHRIIESSSLVSHRNWEKRRKIRENTYINYLKNAKIKNYPSYSIAIKGNLQALYDRRAENLVVGIYDQQDKFLGIGKICKVDYYSKILKILSKIVEKPKFIVIGKIRLDDNLHEISSEFS